ncbi:swr complex subunit [Metarhizium acridum]|uniref:SWR1-complex protein 5 n=1 Tax=Metarhizium acridum (strain CQMa 102) TaxID=655827 RepID=E9DSJ8_METAQ|nr:SWR1-complex protein 5 [Metarhizium acridum CQMa 102]EFY93358.1 SWR1-complex protein 5 [Metarhizium acridum CQMa 102]KAG8416620.1 swr complex subunit [Metarhizium acridum]KAG8427029.1 swr complex subunit [Metarhizium acridum]
MPPDPVLDEEDEQYASSQDSDFAPDEAPEPVSDQSDAEDAEEGDKKRRSSEPDGQAHDDGYDNSGDEAIIAKGTKRRKRAEEKGRPIDEDEGGEGGLVKTRAQRAAEKEERKYAVNHGPVTIDVDALWAQMMSGEQIKPSTPPVEANGEHTKEPSDNNAAPTAPSDDPQSDTIRIKRTYNFAGRVHTEEKVVARDSAEAKLYLASQGQDALDVDSSPTKRATRKAFRSAFEPVVDVRMGRADLNLGLAARIQAGKEARAKKLNTVEKSRMDWAGYVDQEGIKDELELASKSKDSYTARQDFLARSEAIREDDARRARIAGKS